MRYFRLILILTIIILSQSLLIPSEAFAYINPSVGSYFIQTIIAVVLGGMFIIKLNWNRLKIYLKNLFKRK